MEAQFPEQHSDSAAAEVNPGFGIRDLGFAGICESGFVGFGIDKFPRHERFGLTFQIRKAAVSVPSNIAEGTRHRTPGYISRVIIALGEHAELETRALLSQRRGYIQKEDMKSFNDLSTSVGQPAHGLLRSLEAGSASESGS